MKLCVAGYPPRTLVGNIPTLVAVGLNEKPVSINNLPNCVDGGTPKKESTWKQ